MPDNEWATVDDIINDAEAVREFEIEYRMKGGAVKKVKFYYCELTSADSPLSEISAILDENGKPKDLALAAEYSDRQLLKRLMKANGKADGWEMTPEKWGKLPDYAKAEIAKAIKGIVEERNEDFQTGP